MILSKLFLLVFPFGSIAWRANLFSATAAVWAFFLFDALARKITGREGLSLAGASAFALSSTFWSQAEMAEVYTLQALLLLLFLWAAHAVWEGRGGAPWAAFCWGLLLACHVGLAPLTPLVLFLLPSVEGSGIAGRLRGALRLLPPLLLPLFLYVYVPLRSLADPAVDWGNPETPRALWAHLTNRQVRGRMFSLPWEEYLHRGWDFLALLAGNLHLLLPFALAGAAVGWRRKRPLALFLAAVALADAGFVILLDTAPLASEAYAIPSVAALSLLAVWGLSRFERPLLARLATVGLAGAASLSLVGAAAPNDLHGNFLVRDAAESLLAEVPHGGALFVQEDSTTNAVVYLTAVEGARPDAEIFDRFGNLLGSVYDRPLYEVPAAERPAYRRAAEEPVVLTRLDRGQRVLFSTPRLDYSPEGFRLVPGDFASTAHLRKASPPTSADSGFPPPRVNAHPDWMSRQILAELATRRAEAALATGRAVEAGSVLEAALPHADLPELLLAIGQQARRAGVPSLAESAANAALARRRAFPAALSLKGALLLDAGRADAAETMLRAAVAADPALPQPHALLGQIAARRGDWGAAREAYGRALAADPRQADLLHDRALASLALRDLAAAEADLRAALSVRPDHRGARLKLIRLLGESGRVEAVRAILCSACEATPPSEWPAAELRDLLLHSARAAFPPCVGDWLAGAPALDGEAQRLVEAYRAAGSRVREWRQER